MCLGNFPFRQLCQGQRFDSQQQKCMHVWHCKALWLQHPPVGIRMERSQTDWHPFISYWSVGLHAMDLIWTSQQRLNGCSWGWTPSSPATWDCCVSPGGVEHFAVCAARPAGHIQCRNVFWKSSRPAKLLPGPLFCRKNSETLSCSGIDEVVHIWKQFTRLLSTFTVFVFFWLNLKLSIVLFWFIYRNIRCEGEIFTHSLFQGLCARTVFNNLPVTHLFRKSLRWEKLTGFFL